MAQLFQALLAASLVRITYQAFRAYRVDRVTYRRFSSVYRSNKA